MRSTARAVTRGLRQGLERPKGGRFRLLPIVTPVTLAAIGVLALGAWTIGSSDPSLAAWVELCTLLAAAIFVEAFPVPLRRGSAGGVSLAAVFIVATGSLYGWAFAAVLAFATRGAIELVQRRPLVRLAYNSSVYALSGAAAGLASGVWSGEEGVTSLLLQVTLGATAFYLTNVLLVGAIIARASGERPDRVLSETGRSTLLPFAIMASVTLILDALWQRSPFLSAALVGPLVATSLYQRSVHRALEAMELALTDPLTGLGNQRRFRERLQRQLDEADETGTHLTLCLLDIDDFKEVNDRHGHPLGDRALEVVGAGLRHDGEGFRLGGDEFALLLPGCDAGEGFAIATRVVARIRESEIEPGVTVSVSAGAAAYPGPGITRGELVQLADRTLYAAKAEGKNTVRLYQPGVVELSTRRAHDESDRRARLRAAACLAGAIDVRDASTGSHSQAVAEFAARIAARLGLSGEEVELARLAGQLHDLGKLAIGEEILLKPGPLGDEERQLVRTHPHIGYRMLSSLGIEPVATWVLHHHERWDGLGYPDGLAGEEIPTGSRILFVADAYEAMTADRVYRGRLSHDGAIAELRRCAGSQFDPRVVEALIDELEPAAAASL
jgi:diguanylate cyclase (GGDEF)-like protein